MQVVVGDLLVVPQHGRIAGLCCVSAAFLLVRRHLRLAHHEQAASLVGLGLAEGRQEIQVALRDAKLASVACNDVHMHR